MSTLFFKKVEKLLFFDFSKKVLTFTLPFVIVIKLTQADASVAQLDRVTGYEPVGQGFESLLAHQKKRLVSTSRFFSYICLRQVILLRSYIRLTPSDIVLRTV